MKRCTHLDQIHNVQPSAQGCEECPQMGDTRVHLRECLTCGHVGVATSRDLRPQMGKLSVARA
jgi:Zn ribbon nucleic-acid-binding protein